MPSSRTHSDPSGDRRRRGPVERVVGAALRRAVATQSNAAAGYVERLRAGSAGASPARVLQLLDRRFLAAVTASGSAVGATSAVPGIGTVSAMGAIGAESVAFLELATLYTMAVAYVHGVDPRDDAHRETLVMSVLLGSSGTALLGSALDDAARSERSLARRAISLPSVADLNSRLLSLLVRRVSVRRGALALGKLAPAGIGAVVGGWGNRKLGRQMVSTAHATFGAPPAAWS